MYACVAGRTYVFSRAKRSKKSFRNGGNPGEYIGHKIAENNDARKSIGEFERSVSIKNSKFEFRLLSPSRKTLHRRQTNSGAFRNIDATAVAYLDLNFRGGS